MKRKILLTLGAVLGLGLLVSTAWVGITHAANVQAGDSVAVAANDTVDGTLYIAGNNVRVAGTVKGDVFCAGSHIEITGVVEGDVICAGQGVMVGGKVMGDVRVAGQNVEVNGEVTGNVTMFGESLVTGTDAKIGRDITFGGTSAYLQGMIGRDVLGGGQKLTVVGEIGRNVSAEIETLVLDAKSKIGGNLDYRGPNTAQVASGAIVVGETHYTEQAENNTNTATVIFWGALYGFVSLLLIGLAGVLLAPRVMDAFGAAVRTRPLSSFSAGAAVLLVSPLLAILLFASLFGIPLAIIVSLAWIIGLMLSAVIAAYAIGWFTVEKLNWPPRARRLASLVTGLLLFTIIGLVPYVGGVVVFILMLCGLGAIAIAMGGKLFPAKTTKQTAK